MTNRVPDYFEKFACLAGDCPDTCCGQWEIVVDEAAKGRYLSVEGALGQKIRAALTVVDGEDCMVLDHGRCPLLTAEGLCPIVSELGEEFLSTTCHTHPRFTEEYGALRETMLSISCPAAADLLLDRTETLTFVTTVDDQPVDGPNDLDPDLFRAVMQSRRVAFALVQDRSRSLTDRLALLLDFSNRLQRLLDREAWTAAEDLGPLYENLAYQDGRLTRLRRKRRNGTLTLVRQLLLSMEHLSPNFPKLLEDLELVNPGLYTIPAEQLTVYFLFRWWLKAACNGKVRRQAAAAVVSVLAVCGLAKTTGDFKEAARTYSKEVEHSDDNMALLRGAMELDVFAADELYRLL